jgi:two-component SAPR family response regulator
LFGCFVVNEGARMTTISCQHRALFYENPTTLWAQAAALINQAADAGSHWRYLADEHSVTIVTAALRERQVTISQEQVIDSAQCQLRASPIRIPPILSALRQLIQQMQAEGAPAVLLLIEMTWAIRTPSGDVYLREYEAALHALHAACPLTLVCLYNTAVLLDQQLLTGLHTHPQLQTLQGVQANPHFLPPDLYAQRNLRAQFEYWVQQVANHPRQDSEPATTEHPPQVAVVSASQQPPNLHVRPLYHLQAPTPLIASNGDQNRWKIRCLGHLRVYREDGEPVQWNVLSGATRKTKTLFAYLLYRGEQGATVEEIADLLWPDAGNLKQSLNRLYHTVRCLRSALSPELPSGRESPYLIARDQRYFLAVPPNTWIDLPLFQEMCYRGATHLQNGNWDEALLCLQSAERLYTGDLFADIPDKYAANHEQDWCWSQRYWLRNMQQKVLCATATVYRQQGKFSEALTYCDQVLQHDPVSEMAHQEKLRTLAATKRYDALQRQYRLYCQALAEFEVGPPTEETTALYQSLLS